MTAIRKTMNGKTLNTLRLQTNQDQPLVAAQQKTCFISSTQESGLHLGFIETNPLVIGTTSPLASTAVEIRWKCLLPSHF